jgi:predicted transcriptional regulator
MKCLSLKQPYAELLISGKKTIELRKWNTNFRGQFLVHASKNVNKEKCEFLGIDCNILDIGAILGTLDVYGVGTNLS